MRDNTWLKNRLDNIWNIYFYDIEKKNIITTRFKGRWKNKFGHIKLLKNKATEICVNGLFADETIPEYIINLTLAHEIVHYSHGFQSPHEKCFKYPHKGGIVKKELKQRGFSTQLKDERKWVKKEWINIYKTLNPKPNPEKFKPQKSIFLRFLRII